MSSLIQLQNVGKVFQSRGVETHALADISLDIDRGEYCAISGPSGSGKTTLLSVLGLLEPPDSGTYLLDGENAWEHSARERVQIRNRQIGFVFQSFNLIDELTVWDNVALPLTYRGTPGEERDRRVTEALDRVGMSHRAQLFPAELSGGQQQRVAVARAIVGRPSILLADEPTGNLDSKSGESLMQMFAELHADGATVCLATHDPRWVTQAQRHLYLFDGRLVDQPAES